MRGAPQSGLSILIRPDQRAQLRLDWRPPSPSTRFPTAVATKAGPVPTHERLGPRDRENPEDCWKPTMQVDKEPAIMVRQPDATMQPTSQDDQLMSKHRVLGFKSQLRLEWRGQDGNRAARSFRQLTRFHHGSNSDEVFGTHRIRDKPTAPASPWQNGFVERLIGSIRRECVDHIIVLGEVHLRQILKSYARYYNETRTHLAVGKDAPVSRPVQRTGVISSCAILRRLHHHYARA